jgi:hypothetical protein
MLCKADYVYLTYLMLQRQLSNWNGRKLDRLQVLFCKSVLYCAHVHSHDFVLLLLVASTVFLYNRIHTKDRNPCAIHGPVCTLENFHC